jgi:glycosyltransferase involved in cell wall biosynthesis
MEMNPQVTSGSDHNLVSVIIPVWNRAALLPETLRSLQAQTHRRFEAIIVDDGSTDDTAAVARQFCENDARFVLLQQPHGGASAARNTAIERARGEWIAFLDSDDVWLPEKLARQLALFREDPRVNFTYTNFYIWDGQRDLSLWYRAGQPLPEGDMGHKIVFNVSYACAASMSTAMVRREIFHTIGHFDPELAIGEDWDLWLRLAECGLWVRGTREPLARYRRWPLNATNQRLTMAEANVRVLEKNLRATQHPELRPLYRRSLGLARAKVEFSRTRRMIDSSPDKIPAAVWRAWRLYPRRLKWLMWFALVSWPNLLGGRAMARIVHRKLIQKF